ncbi:hypothetical protein CYMTET_26777 [Cymbomonas tetramitiformis]|uniref:Uncharacterized protein n=1 Tax=Cymbomonas tetramitiformis TaxID=36881 RepID=A0AAE0FR09_9CHLO|nr:hypothetical protein CYMTET_26777 [Cymbomonas tetramitiformis]
MARMQQHSRSHSQLTPTQQLTPSPQPTYKESGWYQDRHKALQDMVASKTPLKVTGSVKSPLKKQMTAQKGPVSYQETFVLESHPSQEMVSLLQPPTPPLMNLELAGSSRPVTAPEPAQKRGTWNSQTSLSDLPSCTSAAALSFSRSLEYRGAGLEAGSPTWTPHAKTPSLAGRGALEASKSVDHVELRRSVNRKRVSHSNAVSAGSPDATRGPGDWAAFQMPAAPDYVPFGHTLTHSRSTPHTPTEGTRHLKLKPDIPKFRSATPSSRSPSSLSSSPALGTKLGALQDPNQIKLNLPGRLDYDSKERAGSHDSRDHGEEAEERGEGEVKRAEERGEGEVKRAEERGEGEVKVAEERGDARAVSEEVERAGVETAKAAVKVVRGGIEGIAEVAVGTEDAKIVSTEVAEIGGAP